jgi:Mg2+ and Co2+ transporter CorA
MPIVHTSAGFWWTFGFMLMVVVVVVAVFWRKRYLSRIGR